MYQPVSITEGRSSFGTEPASSLDPDLFDDNEVMYPDIRAALLSTIETWLDENYRRADIWIKVWLAGSGASYRWNTFGESLGDLDILLGVDWVKFRAANPDYSRMSDVEIASEMNDKMRHELWPLTAQWRGKYEVTWYVNPRSQDIRHINPYAAYDLRDNSWTVRPSTSTETVPRDWEVTAERFHDQAETLVKHYAESLRHLQNASVPHHRADAERRFGVAVDAAVALYDTVHAGRRTAFAPNGGGYGDFSNYLWQHGKKWGWMNALKDIKDYHQSVQEEGQMTTYGLTLPDADTLVRRAASYGGSAYPR